jgi:hypothetical protein
MPSDSHKRWKRKTAPVSAYQVHVKRLIDPLLNIVSKGLILDSEHIIVEPLPDGRVRLRLRDGIAFRGGGPGGSTVTIWGQIIGTLSDQADLQAALDAKMDNFSSRVRMNTSDGPPATITLQLQNDSGVWEDIWSYSAST